MSINYLIYAEILLTIELLKIDQGKSADFSSIECYLDIAEEYAALNRNTREYLVFAKILRTCAYLLVEPEKTKRYIEEIMPLLADTTPFFQTLAYWYLANALQTLGRDMDSCKTYYSQLGLAKRLEV